MTPYGNLIGGRWVNARSGRTFADLNPADRSDQLGLFQRSDKSDVRRAVKTAREAYPGWSELPAPKRGEILFRAAWLLERRKEELSALMCREMGKTLRECRGDVQEAVDTAYYFAGEGRRLFGLTTPSELPNKHCLTLRRPVGVCGLITPWNFPLAIPAWKLFPALVCGNTVVLKPAEDTPLLALRLAEILHEAGLPAGVLNVVTGLGGEAGAALAGDPGVDLVSFTGSSAVGARVAGQCGSALKRCALELGGKNAQIVLDDADLGLACEAAVWGAFATSGQRCTATSRIILHRSIHDRFLKRFLKRTRQLRVGPGHLPGVDLGPIINEKQLKSVQGHVKRAVREGARLALGGTAKGLFHAPTVLTNVNASMAIARQEVFGPVTAVIKAADADEAIAIANATAYGLSSSIFTRSVAAAMHAVQSLQAGITYVNGSTIGAEAHLPFGGVKHSGNGHREAGPTALDIFSEWKTVYIDSSGKLQRAQID